jgi:hypothetical protein
MNYNVRYVHKGKEGKSFIMLCSVIAYVMHCEVRKPSG